MPNIHTGTSAISSSHFQLMVIRALNTYKKLTKEDLFTHPLAAQLQACNSPGAILQVLQEQVQVHTQSQCNYERLTHYLDHSVNVVHNFTLALEGGVGLDISLAKPILAGVGILILAARDVRASYNIITDVFEHIVYFFRRLHLYTEVSPTNEMKNVIAKMLVEVLSILAIATMEIKQCLMKKWWKKLLGKAYIHDALRRLDKQTQEEARSSTSRALRAIIMSMNGDINGSLTETAYNRKGAKEAMLEKGNDIDKTKRSSSPQPVSPYNAVYGWEKDNSLPLYTTAPPAYGTPEIVNLPCWHGTMVETQDNEGKSTLDGF